MNTLHPIKALAFSFLVAATLTASEMPTGSAGTAPATATASSVNPWDILRTATKGTLYSLEPGEKPAPGEKSFHNYKVLGQMELDPKQVIVAKDAFVAAVAGGDKYGSSLCMINPRHALSIVADGHTYDFLLCFACGQMQVMMDNKEIAFVNAGGSQDVLNNLLTAGKVPLSQSGLKLAAERAAGEKRVAEARTRWAAAMPKSLLPFWVPETWERPWADAAPYRAPLAKEFPDVTQRIRALLSWYGSGSPDWANVPFYEQAAIDLLHDYTTAEIVAAIQAGPLTEAQLEGAARTLSSYSKTGPGPSPKSAGPPQAAYDLNAIPAPIKAVLLEHVLKSGNRYNISFANWAFSPSP